MEPVIVLTAGSGPAGSVIQSRVEVPCTRDLTVEVRFDGKRAPRGSAFHWCEGGQLTIDTKTPDRPVRVLILIKRGNQTLTMLAPRVF